MAIKWTDSQLRATQVPIGATIVVSAGAGTGKTSVLSETAAEKMVAEKKVSVANLLVLTFTRKAAAEMAERIERRLIELANARDDPEERDRLLREAGEVSDAAIETLDAFAQRLLREHAAIAGIDPAFEVLDPPDARRLGEQAARECLERWRDDPPHELWPDVTAQINEPDWPRLLTHLDERLITRGGPSLAALLLGKRGAKEVTSDEVGEALLKACRERLNQARKELLDEIAPFKELLQETAEEGKDKKKPPNYPKQAEAIIPDVQPLRAWLQRDSLDWDDPIVEKVGGWDLWRKHPKASHARNESLRIAKAVKACIIGEKEKKTETLRNLELDLELCEHRKGLAAAILSFHNHFLDARREKNALTFADCEIEALDLLNKSPEICDRYRKQFEYVVVDEYQDINPLQQELIFKLCRPSTGGRDSRRAVPANLYVVGDERQSIFGFRGAVCDLLKNLRERIGAGSRILHDSFRSRPEILNLVNHVFRALWDDPEMHSDLQPAFGPYLKADPGEGRIELHLVDKTGDAASARRMEAANIARRLAELVREECPLIWKRNEEGVRQGPIKWGDCAVLLRKRSSFPLYEEAFAALDIPCIPELGGGFWDLPEIADACALLSCLSPAPDNLDWAVFLRSPWVGLSDAALLAIARHAGRKGDWGEASRDARMPSDNDNRRLAEFHRWFEAVRPLAGRMSIGRLFEKALDRSGYAERVFAQERDRLVRANIEKLLSELTTDQGTFDVASAADRIRWLRSAEIHQAQASVAAEESEDAVTLATVHGAKGLEWPLVVLPELDRRPKGRSGEIFWNDEEGLAFAWNDAETGLREKPAGYIRADQAQKHFEEAEELRLLYVALTRARERLILSGTVKRSRAKTNGEQVDEWEGFRESDKRKDINERKRKRWLAALDGALFGDERQLVGRPSDEKDALIEFRVADPQSPGEDDGRPLPVERRNTNLAVRRVIHSDVEPLLGKRRIEPVDQTEIETLREALEALPMLPKPTARRYLVTVTEVAAFDSCPRMYAYRAVWLVPPRQVAVRAQEQPEMQEATDSEVGADTDSPPREQFELPVSEWGSLCHRAMERVPFDAGPDEIRRLAEDVCGESGYSAVEPLPERLSEGRPTGETLSDRLADIVAGILRAPIFDRVRSSDEAKREYRLLGRLGEKDEIVQGTLDLLVWHDGRLLIIDYKSGRVERDKVPTRVNDYALQLALYAHLVAGRAGVDPSDVDAHILFLDPPIDSPVKLDGSLLKRAIDAVDGLEEMSQRNEFIAKPSSELCRRCDYWDICPQRQGC